MQYAKPNEVNIGDSVLVPINGEEGEESQICQEYVVVKALKCKTPAHRQIVATGQEPMPILIEFTDQTGFLLEE